MVLRMGMGPCKNDPFGLRKLKKFIEVPEHLVSRIQVPGCSYNELYQVMNRLTLGFPPHSIRREAINALTETYEPLLITALSCHSSDLNNTGIQAYILPRLTQKIPMMQREMSVHLMDLILNSEQQLREVSA